MSTQTYRILYHHRTQGRGGEGHHIVSVIRELRNLGHQVDVLSPAGIDPFKLTEDAPVDKTISRTSGLQSLWSLISRRAPLWLFELVEIAYNLPAAWRLHKALNSQHYDFIYERYAFYLIAGSWLARRHSIPLILEANEVTGIPDRARRQQFSALCTRFERYLLNRSAVVLPVSSYLSEMVQQHAPASLPIRVIPNAINPTILDTPSVSTKPTQLSNKTIIGFAGWFDDWDRLDLLLDVLNNLSEQFPKLHLLLVGDGPCLTQIRETITQLDLEDRVTITGSVPRSQVLNYLRWIDIAILPHSNTFGSPIILFEFFGLKIPVVAPRLPPLQDVITHGENGLLFMPQDVIDCGRQVTNLLKDEPLIDRIADNAYQKLMKQYTWQNNAKQIIEAFENI